jgi:succinyl-CoA synthetase alpha subunit
MSVLVGYDTRLVVQGMSGSAGAFHAKQMVEYGTRVVAGVTPGKGGAKVAGLEQVPMFDTVFEAVEKAGANTTVIYVPPPRGSASSSRSPRASPRATWCG